MTDFADLIATSIANAATRDELLASRARIVAAADDARRRIERELHDGAQQRLVALDLGLRAAEACVPDELQCRAGGHSYLPLLWVGSELLNRLGYIEVGLVVPTTPANNTPGQRRKYDNRRRRADAAARQRRIIDAATALFVADGFGATSIDQIAAAADVSLPNIYATYGSKAGVLAQAIAATLVGDYDEIPVIDRAPGFADIPDAGYGVRFATHAKFIRVLNQRVGPLIRVMEQAASSDPALGELRSGLAATLQADCRHWIDQLGPQTLRPGLSPTRAVDVMAMIISPYVYSMLTSDFGFTPNQYQQWLAHALPHLLLKPELLGD